MIRYLMTTDRAIAAAPNWGSEWLSLVACQLAACQLVVCRWRWGNGTAEIGAGNRAQIKCAQVKHAQVKHAQFERAQVNSVRPIWRRLDPAILGQSILDQFILKQRLDRVGSQRSGRYGGSQRGSLVPRED
nr:MAG: hypothetical protein EDM05_07540 [Leptolyngbya sp. IPPAS B-1204]